MLKLLFMKELEHIVKSYEAYRQALLSEMEARKQRQQWYAQQPNKNFIGNMWCVCAVGTSRCHTSLRFPQFGSGRGFPLKSWLTLNCLFTKHICAFAWSKYISQEVERHVGGGLPSPDVTLNLWMTVWLKKTLQWRKRTYNVVHLERDCLWCHLQPWEMNGFLFLRLRRTVLKKLRIFVQKHPEIVPF